MSLVFHQLNETTLFATLKCQSPSSLKYRFCWFHKAYLVLRRLLEQDIVLRNDSLVTEACHLVLVRGDQPKENTQLFTSTSLYKKYIIPSESLVSPCLFA